MLSRHYHYRQRLKAKLESYRAGPCERCGSKRERRELAHAAPTPLSGRGRGLSQRYHDLRKHPLCYARLCLKCHGLVDARAAVFVRVEEPDWA